MKTACSTVIHFQAPKMSFTPFCVDLLQPVRTPLWPIQALSGHKCRWHHSSETATSGGSCSKLEMSCVIPFSMVNIYPRLKAV